MSSTSNSVRRARNGAPDSSERVRRRTVESIAHALEGGPSALSARLGALEQEWDAQRAFEAGTAVLGLVGLGLSTRDRRWLGLSGVASLLLLQRALQGWSLPERVLRKLGLRTRREIDHERYALKAARGDFDTLHPPAGPNTLLTLTEI